MFNADYDAGYKEGFAEGIKHAQAFIAKSAQPPAIIIATTPAPADDNYVREAKGLLPENASADEVNAVADGLKQHDVLGIIAAPATDSASGPVDERAEGYAAGLQRGAEIAEALQEIVNSGVEFDDPRMRYVLMQVDRGALADARTALKLKESE